MLTNFKKWVQTTVDTTLSEFPINDFINDTNGVVTNHHKNGAQTKLQGSISTSFQKSAPLLNKNRHLPLNAKHTLSSPITIENRNVKNNISDSFNSNYFYFIFFLFRLDF